jgi:hypothetical protein
MSTRFKQIDMENAKAIAREMTRNRTCEGCIALRVLPRPMCAGEASPHFRTVRETYHERCASYTVAGRQMPAPKPVEPPKRKPRMKLVKLREGDQLVTEDEYDALLARNLARRARA